MKTSIFLSINSTMAILSPTHQYFEYHIEIGIDGYKQT